ncbi:MAG TPA: glycoside hydrolase family 15 protein [Pseudolysinimonas sp.]|jgi:GH15 family glucan-1,4-alpha-glucosidase
MTDADSRIGSDERAGLAGLARTSLDLIVRLQDPSGAYPASPTFSAYRGYSWFRDGAFIADGVSSAGGIESAERFFDWCAGILRARSAEIIAIVDAARAGEPVADSAMLGTRFTLDGADGADEWWDFQLDGYGTWLWAVAAHARRHDRSLEPWRDAIALTVEYLLSSWRRPCFDWWEEHADHVHVSTLGCIAGGLLAVLDEDALDTDTAARAIGAVGEIDALIGSGGVADGHLTKWLGSTEVDASLAALVFPLEVFPAEEPLGSATLDAVDAALNVGGGVHRYLDDTFYGGGQWPLLSCMLGLGFAARGDRDGAFAQLRWAAQTAVDGEELPEQVADHLLFPERRAEWVLRWGTVATPLLWSHAMYLRLAVELGVVEFHDAEAAR